MELSERIIQLLPPGVTPDQVHLLFGSAEVDTTTEIASDDSTVQAVLMRAGPPLVNADKKPTILKVVAWMAHEGVNDNRQAFVGSELASLAPTLFREPNFGVMDFNHSAAKHFMSEDPKVIGVWYKADYMFDEAAGKHGILATGMMFSWLFPEHADSLLADQERLGRMRFSMMAFTQNQEIATDALGEYIILHDPVFLAVSALDVRPADRNATGVGSESVQEDEDTLRNRLFAAALQRPWQGQLQAANLNQDVANEGAAMTETETKLVELAEAKVRLEGELLNAQTALANQKTEFETKIAELNAAIEALNTKVTEAEVARESANTEHTSALEKVKELEAKVAELETFKASIDEKTVEEDRATRLAELKKKLPESYLLAFEKKPAERQKVLEEKWVAMTDEEFSVYLEDELGYQPETRLSYFDRSRNEGHLPANDGDGVDKMDIGGRVRKLLRR